MTVADAYMIRCHLFHALNIPAQLCPLLHAWAIVEGRAFCHEFMADLLCLSGTEKATRVAVARRLDALASFLKTSTHDLGSIRRGGGGKQATTEYGAFYVNRAVAWVQEQLASDPDTANPFVAVDRYTAEAIARHVPLTPKPKPAARPKAKKGSAPHREKSERNRQPLGHRSEAWFLMPDSLLKTALKLACEGFRVFPVWGVKDGVCLCPKRLACKTPGKHPIPRHWRQIAERSYPPTLIKFWAQHPEANVGIATGTKMPNGEYLTVVDVDERHFGHGTLSALERGELCPLPATREHSAGGGPHKLFTYPRGFSSYPGALGQGIDVQSYGKFVIASGMNARGKPYEVTLDLPVARLPQTWADRIESVSKKTLPLVPEGQRRAKLLAWAGGMARDGRSIDLIIETLKDRREHRLAKGSHSFSDTDLREIAAYCVERERMKPKQRTQAA